MMQWLGGLPENLIDFRAAWKQRLESVQLGEDAPNRPDVDGRRVIG